MSVGRIGEPRRHDPLLHYALDARGPWTHFLIGEQWKRRRLSRTMARLAVLLEYRCNVLRKSRGRHVAHLAQNQSAATQFKSQDHKDSLHHVASPRQVASDGNGPISPSNYQ